jgi:hypothetical protein
MLTFLVTWNAGQNVLWQKELLAFLDTKFAVKNYYAPFVGAILLVTSPEQNIQTVKDMLHQRFPDALFVVTRLDPASAQGWMPKLFWDFINEPKSSGHWDKVNNDALLALLGMDKEKLKK